jgi:WD40 repeat protein
MSAHFAWTRVPESLVVWAAVALFGCGHAGTGSAAAPSGSPGQVGATASGNQSLGGPAPTDSAWVQGSDFGGGFTILAHPTLPLMFRGDDADLLVHDAHSAAVVAVIPGGSSELRALAVAPDGRRVFAGDVRGELAVWDLTTGTYRTLAQEPGPLFEIAFAPDSPAFVTSGRGYAHYYASEGAPPRPLPSLSQVRLLPGGKYLVGRDPSLTVVDLSTATVVATVPGGSRWNPSWLLGADARTVTWIGEGDTLLEAQIPALASPRTLARIPGAGYLYGSADGARLLVDGSGQAVLLDRQGRTIVALPGARADVVDFSPTGRLFAVRTDRSLSVHDARSGNKLRTFELDGSPGDISWCGDESGLFAQQRRRVDLLSLGSGSVVRAASAQRSVSEITFHPDGQLVDLEEHFAGHHLLDLRRGAWVRTLPVPRAAQRSETIEELSFSPTGQYYAAGTRHSLDIVQFPSGAERSFVTDPSFSAMREGIFSPDGSRVLVLGDRVGSASVRDVASARELLSVAPAGRDSYFAGAFSPNGTRLALAGHTELRVADAATGAVLMDGKVPDTTLALVWLDADRLLSGHNHGQLLVWSVRSRETGRPVEGTRDHVQDIAVSSDGRLAAVIGRHYFVELIDTASLKVVGRLRTTSGEMHDVEWHPCLPIVGVAHGAATFFDVQSGTWLRVALLGEEESPEPPVVAVTRSDGHVGGDPRASAFLWVRRGGPTGPAAPAAERPELFSGNIGEAGFGGCAGKR